MIVKTLAENTTISENYGSEHGLSLYIETKKHKLLFDMGKTDLFLQNAIKMNVELSEVDIAVISHGHYDHGGGLKWFLEKNSKAKIYVNKKAFEGHYSKRPNGIADIGLDASLQINNRINLVGDYLRIDDELELFSGVNGRELPSLSNKTLLMMKDGVLVEDAFEHEQNLIITEENKTLLVAGCAHNGIVNIMERFMKLKGATADTVIGGFHLFNPSTNQTEARELIHAIGEKLEKSKTLYYTCHCTGLVAYKQLQEVLKEQIQYLATSSVVEI